MKILALILVLIIGAFAVWVRTAPFDPDDWHTDPVDAPDERLGGFKTSLDLPGVTPAEALERLLGIAANWPRTQIAFGTVDEGRVSFITRSRLWGFPDVTTVSAQPSGDGSRLTFYARLRFGREDMNVNRDRVQAWVRQLQDQSVTVK